MGSLSPLVLVERMGRGNGGGGTGGIAIEVATRYGPGGARGESPGGPASVATDGWLDGGGSGRDAPDFDKPVSKWWTLERASTRNCMPSVRARRSMNSITGNPFFRLAMEPQCCWMTDSHCWAQAAKKTIPNSWSPTECAMRQWGE